MKVLVKVEFEPRDMWIGVYWFLWRDLRTMKPYGIRLYICILPTLPIVVDIKRGSLLYATKSGLYNIKGTFTWPASTPTGSVYHQGWQVPAPKGFWKQMDELRRRARELYGR